MALGPHFLPVFEQLGMLDDLYEISYECPTVWQFKEDMELLGEIGMRGVKEL